MSATIHRLPTARPRPATDDTLRADCERLMRTLVRDGRTPEQDMRALADFLDHIITRSEGCHG